ARGDEHQTLAVEVSLAVLALLVGHAPGHRPGVEARRQRGADHGDAGAGREQAFHLALAHRAAAHHQAGVAPQVEGDGVILRHLGCAVRRRWGLSAFQPLGNFALASSSVTAGTMITSSPCFQFTGVATRCASVGWSESITRRISSKFRPVVCGYVIIRRIFFLGSMTNTVRTVYTSSWAGCIMP